MSVHRYGPSPHFTLPTPPHPPSPPPVQNDIIADDEKSDEEVYNIYFDHKDDG